MNMTNSGARLTAAILCLSSLPLGLLGCSGNVRIVNPTVERRPVVFESSAAESAFEEELQDRYDDGEADVKQPAGRLSLNAFFNDQVKVADRDNDGIITDSEAQRYGE